MNRTRLSFNAHGSEQAFVYVLIALCICSVGCRMPGFGNPSEEDHVLPEYRTSVTTETAGATGQTSDPQTQGSGLRGGYDQNPMNTGVHRYDSPKSVSTQHPLARGPLSQQATHQQSAATVRVHGVRPQSGPVRVAVFSEQGSFPNHAGATSKSVVTSAAESVETPLNVVPGNAVAVYQDLNNDGTLNRSSLGLPSEPYGFSGNAAARFGPPRFQDAVIASTSEPIEVTLR